MILAVRRWLIERLGGYPDLDAVLSAVKELPFEDKHKILTAAVRRHLNIVGPDDIFRIHENGQWLHAGKQMRPEEVALIRAEAQQFQKSRLWKILQDELKYQANRKLYTLSESVLDIVAGKLLVYYIDIVKTRLSKML